MCSDAAARGLPDPVVGPLPDRLDVLDDGAPPRPHPRLDCAQHLRGREQDGDDLAVDVQLELLGCRVADPHRLGALVAGKLRQLVLGQPPLAADPVHDLDLRRVAGAGTQQVVAERDRLVGVPGCEQRLQRKHRVAQPAIAVVPVAHSADVLRQRRRRRGDEGACRLGGHRLQHDQRRQHLVAIRAVVRAAPAPVPPPRVGARERRVGVLDRRRRLIGEVPREGRAVRARPRLPRTRL